MSDALHTVETAKAWVAQHDVDLERCYLESFGTNRRLIQVYKCGAWLSQVLENAGCPRPYRASICFAHGQHCHNSDPCTVAVAFANEYHSTGHVADADIPPSELAARLDKKLAERN